LLRDNLKEKFLIIGYGVSGKAAESFLERQGHEVTVVDKKVSPGVLADSENLEIENFSRVILSPGIPPSHPLVQKAKRRGIEVIGEIELAFSHLQNRCFGITGSNGKTSTVLLTVHILNSANKKSRALGNVGESLSGYLLNGDRDEILIIELSSFQLETIKSERLESAIILNITPNHLDRYESMEQYAEAKSLIRNCLKDKGELYISQQVREDFRDLFPEAKDFEKEVDLLNELSYIQLEMSSKQSIQAAYLLCVRCGVTDQQFLQGLKTFRKPPHRMEWVAEIDGVSYYNDSKSTNVHSVIHAVNQLHEPIVLIVGGLHKGSSYMPWIEKFKGKVEKIIAYGQAAPLMELELKNAFPFQKVDRFADAVALAKAEAKNRETVLLSPGCSSYDQFENFERRGEEFKRLVRE